MKISVGPIAPLSIEHATFWRRNPLDLPGLHGEPHEQLTELLREAHLVDFNHKRITVRPERAPDRHLVIYRRREPGAPRVLAGAWIDASKSLPAWGPVVSFRPPVYLQDHALEEYPGGEELGFEEVTARAVEALGTGRAATHITQGTLFASCAKPGVFLRLGTGPQLYVNSILVETPADEPAHTGIATQGVSGAGLWWMVSQHAADKWLERFEPGCVGDPRERIAQLVMTAVDCGHRQSDERTRIWRTPLFPAADFIVRVDPNGRHAVITVLDPPDGRFRSIHVDRALSKGASPRRVGADIARGRL